MLPRIGLSERGACLLLSLAALFAAATIAVHSVSPPLGRWWGTVAVRGLVSSQLALVAIWAALGWRATG